MVALRSVAKLRMMLECISADIENATSADLYGHVSVRCPGCPHRKQDRIILVADELRDRALFFFNELAALASPCVSV